nr:hypothetical protein BdHM001_33070 [Bdellovibrio sp. HM001]
MFNFLERLETFSTFDFMSISPKLRRRVINWWIVEDRPTLGNRNAVRNAYKSEVRDTLRTYEARDSLCDRKRGRGEVHFGGGPGLKTQSGGEKDPSC